VNTLENKIETLKNQNEQFMRKRFALKELAKDAKNYAILVSTKKGQENMKTAIELEKKIRAGGKNAILLVSDLIRPDYYLGMGFDCFICTACPRIAYDDHLQFRAPVISMDEAIELFMKNK
jgi:2-(3-amino-3-carboxypropyl)histidine synthase